VQMQMRELGHRTANFLRPRVGGFKAGGRQQLC
jgi:hypothetical protein